MMKPAPMSVADLRSLLSYDPNTGAFIWVKAPSSKAARVVGTIAGRTSSAGYRTIKIRQSHFMAHRLAWYLATGDWPDVEVDHVNCIRDDNRLENLRLATPSQNHGNTRSRMGSSSEYKGVTRHKGGKWQAQIEVDGKCIYLGLHATEAAASEAYAARARLAYGDFARAK